MLTEKDVSDLTLSGEFEKVCSLFDRFGSCNAGIVENPVADNIQHPDVQALWEMYRDLKRKHERPPRRAFDIIDFPRLAGNLHVLAFEEGLAMKFLIFGTAVADRYGSDRTGEYLPLEGDNLVVVFHGLFLASAASSNVYHTTHAPPEGAPVKDCQRLILPFFNEEGEFTRMLVSHLPYSAHLGSVARPAWRAKSGPPWR